MKLIVSELEALRSYVSREFYHVMTQLITHFEEVISASSAYLRGLCVEISHYAENAEGRRGRRGMQTTQRLRGREAR